MLERAILFIVWGERHVEAVARCIGESRLPPYPVVVITDETTRTDALPEGVEVFRRGFAYPGKERKAEALAALPPHLGTVLFLDSDTRVIGDVSLGFDKAERHGVAMAPAVHYSLADFRSFGRVMEREGVRPRGQMVYNSGVLFLDWRAPRVRALFAAALTLLRKDVEAPWGDQTYISLAMEMAEFNPYTLSPSFNHRGFGELISGSVRVWHSYAPVPVGAEALAPGHLHRYEQGRLVQALAVPL